MTRFAKGSAALLAALALTAGTAEAQNTDDIQVLANVLVALNVTGDQDLDFQDVLPGVNKTINVDDATAGHFTITGHGTANVNLTFTLPANLTGPGNLAIGSWTGYLNGGSDDPSAGGSAVVPASGVPIASAIGAGGNLWVFIGATVSPTVAQAQGNYTGTVTLLVEYF